jgi:Na+/H+ antiporter NhaC
MKIGDDPKLIETLARVIQSVGGAAFVIGVILFFVAPAFGVPTIGMGICLTIIAQIMHMRAVMTAFYRDWRTKNKSSLPEE